MVLAVLYLRDLNINEVHIGVRGYFTLQGIGSTGILFLFLSPLFPLLCLCFSSSSILLLTSLYVLLYKQSIQIHSMIHTEHKRRVSILKVKGMKKKKKNFNYICTRIISIASTKFYCAKKVYRIPTPRKKKCIK